MQSIAVLLANLSGDQRCRELMTNTHSRLLEEVVRLGGAYVHDASISPKHDDRAGVAARPFYLHVVPPAAGDAVNDRTMSQWSTRRPVRGLALVSGRIRTSATHAPDDRTITWLRSSSWISGTAWTSAEIRNSTSRGGPQLRLATHVETDKIDGDGPSFIRTGRGAGYQLIGLSGTEP